MSKQIKALVLVIFFCVFVYFCWYAYFVQVDNVNENEIPILKAQTNIKFKPDDPGGIDVSNKDKVIYEHMLGKKKFDSNVQVVENSEKPVTRENLEGLIDKQLKSAGIVSKKRSEVIVKSDQTDNPKEAEITPPKETDKKELPINDIVIEPKQPEILKKAEVPSEKIEKKTDEKMSLSINGIEVNSKPVETSKKTEAFVPQAEEKKVNLDAKISSTKNTELADKIDPKSKSLIENYSIRVAKLKNKKFVSKGIEIFQNKYPVLNKYNGQLVEKNGNYFLHFSSISSKQEAEKICKIIAEGGSKCLIFSE